MSKKRGFGRSSIFQLLLGDSKTGQPDSSVPTLAGEVANQIVGREGDNEKYEIEAPIGEGGMGEVFLVSDRDLRRQVAMKILREDLVEDDQAQEYRLLFLSEAQATSQLDHPGVPPVYDIGMAPDGRLYFTMKLVRGRTLREVLHDLLLKRRDVQREFTLHRMMTILERVAETLQFAHERGVVHRDIKPENIMLGDYGEVHVMDWGLARVEDDPNVETSWERVETSRTKEAYKTRPGIATGTLPYMSPEQIRGQTVPSSDVYALGCVLYEVLTLYTPFDPRDGDIIPRVMAAEYPPVEERNPRLPVPRALADICRKAMALGPADRHDDARSFGAALRDWLDGTSERDQRRAAAADLAARGAERVAKYREIRSQLDEAEDALSALTHQFAPWQTVAEKQPLLEARGNVEALQTELAGALADALRLLDAAWVQDDTNAEAQELLLELWKDRLEEAERQHQRSDAAYALSMVQRFDDGRNAHYIEGTGTLSLNSAPEGADVVLRRFEVKDGVLTEAAEEHLGQTPIEQERLSMGSYLCVLSKKGFEPIRYPVHIRRGSSWRGSVRMPEAGTVDEDFSFVPGGPFVYGEGTQAAIRMLGDFLIQRYPVTFGDYGEYLAAIEREQGVEAVDALLPRDAELQQQMVRTDDGDYVVVSAIVTGHMVEHIIELHGPDYGPRLPLTGVTYAMAEAYCGWKSRVTGQTWRLPTEEEWEKSARGVDGRRFPWGDLEDATLAKCNKSRPGIPQPEPVGAFPSATSAYGMVDAAGGAFEWTSSWLDDQQVLGVIRGGSWLTDPRTLSCVGRFGVPRTQLGNNIGFRCARSV